MYKSYFSLLFIAWKQAAFAFGEGIFFLFTKKWTFLYEKSIVILGCLVLSILHISLQAFCGKKAGK